MIGGFTFLVLSDFKRLSKLNINIQTRMSCQFVKEKTVG